MSKKYHELAQAIIDNLGGKENVQDVYHCQTRSRFKLKDGQLVQKSQLEELEGVTMYLFNAGVHQVVIGTHVKNVFEEIEPLVDLNKDEDGKLETENYLQYRLSLVL